MNKKGFARISHKYLLQLRIWVCLRRQARSDTSIVPTVRLRSPRSPSLYPYSSAQFRDNICEKRGLTVVELLVTVALFAFLLIAVFPGMQSFFTRMEINSGLRTVTAALNTARYQAIQENQPVRIEVVPGRLLLSVDNGQGWQVMRSFDLDGKLKIEANGRPVFSPLGNVSPLCTITLQKEARIFRIVLSMYGKISVKSGA